MADCVYCNIYRVYPRKATFFIGHSYDHQKIFAFVGTASTYTSMEIFDRASMKRWFLLDEGFEKDIHVVSDWFSSRYRDEFIDLDSTTFLQRKLDDSPTKSANVSMQMRFINSASRRRKEVLSVNVTRGGKKLIKSRTTMQRCNGKNRRFVFVSIFMIFFSCRVHVYIFIPIVSFSISFTVC